MRRCKWNKSALLQCLDFRGGLFGIFLDCNLLAQCAKMFIYLFAVCNNLHKKAALKCMSCDWVKLLSFCTIAARFFFFCCCWCCFVVHLLSFIISLLTRDCLTVGPVCECCLCRSCIVGATAKYVSKGAHHGRTKELPGYCFRFRYLSAINFINLLSGTKELKNEIARTKCTCF